MRRPCVDREEKRVTHANETTSNRDDRTEQLDFDNPNQRRLSEGDAINPIVTAVGYNFRRLFAWLGRLLAALQFVFCPNKRADRALLPA